MVVVYGMTIPFFFDNTCFIILSSRTLSQYFLIFLRFDFIYFCLTVFQNNDHKKERNFLFRG